MRMFQMAEKKAQHLSHTRILWRFCSTPLVPAASPGMEVGEMKAQHNVLALQLI